MSTSHWYFDIKFSLISWYLYQLGIFTLPALGTPLHWYPLTNTMNKESLLRIPDINFSSISWYQPLFNILISSDQYQSLFDILISTLHWYLGIEHWAHLFINILILSFQYLESGFLISTSHWYLDQLCIDILISTSHRYLGIFSLPALGTPLTPFPTFLAQLCLHFTSTNFLSLLFHSFSLPVHTNYFPLQFFSFHRLILPFTSISFTSTPHIKHLHYLSSHVPS